ncbi:MAG: hypothetical protein PHN84_01375 [Desulfuromonadaceae bacterium]|nr:hypothetical protein [Desulfuromonadaceae bacterium]
MKKKYSILMAVVLVVSFFSLSIAGNRHGMSGGCGDCTKTGLQTDQFRKFQEDTIDIRQEMMTKRFDIQRENLKGTPDAAKIASLQAEVKNLQAKLLQLRSQSGLPTDKCDGECFQSIGGCDKKMGGCGRTTGDCYK